MIELAEDEVHVWVVELDGARMEDDARAQVREILAAYLEIAPESIELVSDEQGKPRLARIGVEFNLSHSGALALVAVAHVPVGIDVEQVEPIEDELHELVEFVLSVRERTALDALPPSERLLAYYRAFTRKEAYLKATGEGISGRPLPEVEFDLAKPELVAVAGIPAAELEGWRVVDVEPVPSYVGALIVAYARPRVTVRSWPNRLAG